MTERTIPKSKVFFGDLYIWQVSSYGKPNYFLDLPADVYRYAPEPRTPQGTLVKSFNSCEEAILWMSFPHSPEEQSE